MKIKVILLLNLFLFFIQSTIFQHFRIVGIIPNLNLIVIVIFVIYFDMKSIIIFSMIAGILQDLFLSPYIGINIFAYLFVALTITNFESVFNKVNIISPVFLILVATTMYNIIFFVFFLIMNLSFNVYELFNIVIIEIVLNMIWMVIIYKFVNNKLLER